MFPLEDYNLVGAGLRGGAHDTAGPPRFVDPATPDYRLSARSPGIDAGTSDGAPAKDLTGAARVDTPAISNTGGGAQPYYEMGALEFTAAYTPPGGSYSSRILAIGACCPTGAWARRPARSPTTQGRPRRHLQNGDRLGAAGAITATRTRPRRSTASTTTSRCLRYRRASTSRSRAGRA